MKNNVHLTSLINALKKIISFFVLKQKDQNLSPKAI
jgi:hypothetical protein